MKLKKKLIKKLIAISLAVAMLTGTGVPARTLSSLILETSITADAAEEVEYSSVIKLDKKINNLETSIKDSLTTFLNGGAAEKYIAEDYSFIYTKNLETNFLLVFNSEHVNLESVLNTSNGKAWATRYSQYLTTLSQMTGFKRDYPVCVINMDIESSIPGACHGQWFHISNDCAFELICAMLNNKFTWTLLHETGHCYSGSDLESTLFNSCEDVYTNFRAICALHYLGWDTEQLVLQNYTSRWNRPSDTNLDSKYKNIEVFQVNDSKYEQYFPQDGKCRSFNKTLGAISVQQYLASTSCHDSNKNHFFSRLAAIFNTVTSKPVSFNYSTDTENSNNWMNVDKIKQNWDSITTSEWQKMYALCIVDSKNVTLPFHGAASCYAYNSYLNSMVYKIKYSYDGKTTHMSKVTSRVLQWLDTYCSKNSNTYLVSGNLLQVFSMYDFMNVDIKKQIIYYRDSSDNAVNKKAPTFYKDFMAKKGDRAFMITDTTATIIVHPKDYNGTVDATAELPITVAGTGNGIDKTIFKWQYNNGSGWKTWDYVYVYSCVSTVTKPLRVTLTAEYNGYQFRCIVTDSNGDIEISNVAKITVR